LTVTVRNIKTWKGPGEYIGRKNIRKKVKASPLQNPFKIKDHGLEGCLIKYRDYLDHLPRDSEQWKLINELTSRHDQGEDLNLLCWCKPKHACHGDILKEIIERSDNKHDKKHGKQKKD
jgi:hypothetical protein